MGEHNFYFALVISVLIISRKSLQMLVCFVKMQKYHVRIVSFLIYPYPLDFFVPVKKCLAKYIQLRKGLWFKKEYSYSCWDDTVVTCHMALAVRTQTQNKTKQNTFCPSYSVLDSSLENGTAHFQSETLLLS